MKESAKEVISVPLKENKADSFDRVVRDLNQSIQVLMIPETISLRNFPIQ